MKRTSPLWSFLIPQTALAFLIASNFFLTSCIYERPRGNNFYRTLWESDNLFSDNSCNGVSSISGISNIGTSDMGSDVPGSNEPQGMTIEFLCGGNISVKADYATGSFGTYEPDGMTVTFTGLTLQYRGETIIFEEGYKDKDTMTVRWHFKDSPESHTMIMHRLSEYR